MKLTTENTENTEKLKWISTDLALPDDGQAVIIHTLGGEVWTGFIDADVWRNVAGARIHEEEPVLHWMPFPEPPEVAK
jgi:hypothetical protein